MGWKDNAEKVTSSSWKTKAEPVKEKESLLAPFMHLSPSSGERPTEVVGHPGKVPPAIPPRPEDYKKVIETAADYGTGAATALSSGVTYDGLPYLTGLSAATQEALGIGPSYEETYPTKGRPPFLDRASDYRKAGIGFEKHYAKKYPVTTGALRTAGNIATVAPTIAATGWLTAPLAASASAGVADVAGQVVGSEKGDLFKGKVPDIEAPWMSMGIGAGLGAAGKVVAESAGGVRRLVTGVTKDQANRYKTVKGKLTEVDPARLEGDINQSVEALESSKNLAKEDFLDKAYAKEKSASFESSANSGAATETLPTERTVSNKPQYDLVKRDMERMKVDGRVPSGMRDQYNKLAGMLEDLQGTVKKETFINPDTMKPYTKETPDFLVSPQGLKRTERANRSILDEIFNTGTPGKKGTPQEIAVGRMTKKEILPELNNPAKYPEYNEKMTQPRAFMKAKEDLHKFMPEKSDSRDFATKNADKLLNKGNEPRLAGIEKFVAGMDDPDLSASFAKYKDTLTKYNEIKGIKPESAYSHIKAAQSAKPEHRLKRETLGKLGPDFTQKAKDIAVHDALTREIPGLSAPRVAQGIGKAGTGRIGGYPAGLAIEAGASLFTPTMYKRWLDFSMKPGFKMFADTFKTAYKAGPAGIAAEHNRLMNTDETYRQMFNED